MEVRCLHFHNLTAGKHRQEVGLKIHAAHSQQYAADTLRRGKVQQPEITMRAHEHMPMLGNCR